MRTGHGPKGSRSPKELTDGVAHSLATDFAKPTGIQLFVRPTHPDATWCELHEASFPDCFFGTSFFSLSVGIRNHWLGVIPRGLLTPCPTTYTFRDTPKPWECNGIGNSATVYVIYNTGRKRVKFNLCQQKLT